MSYSKRDNVTGQVIRLSCDRGKTWSKEMYISSPLNTSDGDLGYPATAQYKDGTFITVFYQRWESDTKPSLMRSLWKLTEKK